jgi:hypothetical protein
MSAISLGINGKKPLHQPPLRPLAPNPTVRDSTTAMRADGFCRDA